MAKNRSSRPKVFYNKGALKNYGKFTEKHLCQGLVINKVAGLSLKKEALAQVLSCKIWEIFKNTYFEEHVRMTSVKIKKNLLL